MKLRDYQQQSINACYCYLRENSGNPAIVCPTGSGKSHIIAQICSDAVSLWNGRVLILAHVKELLEQNADKVKHYLGDDLVGIYSAGLKQRDMHQPVIAASIQSVYKRACEFEPFDLVIVDEAHLLKPDSEGMYFNFIKDAKTVNPHLRLIGTTATPFRMTSGMICGPDNLLNEICYEVGVKELIVKGYLCPLKSKAGRQKADTSGLHLRGGEFIASEIEDLMDQDALVSSACSEIIEQTAGRNSVLIFAAGVGHAKHLQKLLQQRAQQEVGLVTGDTPAPERAELLARFKGQTVKADLFGNNKPPLKYLVNVNVLTTGFDAPNIDCVVLLRPTNSPGLYYQMVGRGFRLHPAKENCLVLDFGNNILRHGPVDSLQITERPSGNGDAPAKECPECHSVIHAAYAICPECGYEFPPPDRQRHDSKASTAGVLSGEVTDEDFDVSGVAYYEHIKRNADENAKPTLRVEYRLGLGLYESEWAGALRKRVGLF
jgi:DNA repair protein RadD